MRFVPGRSEATTDHFGYHARGRGITDAARGFSPGQRSTGISRVRATLR